MVVKEKSTSRPVHEHQFFIGKEQTAIEEQQTVTEKVVYAVADAEGVSAIDLQPLVTVVDPDALNELFQDDRKNVSVEFAYHGYQVHVSGDEQVTVDLKG